MRPNQTILVLEDLWNRFKGPLYRKEVELSSNDRQTVLEVYQQWLLLALDLGYLHHVTLKRDAHRLIVDMTKVDVLDLNNAFAELLRKVQTQDIKGFKALCSGISPHLYNLVKEDFAKIMSGDVYAARNLIQLFSWTSRLSLKDIDLTQQCLDDYMETEQNMSDYLPRGLIRSLNKIIKDWVKPFDSSQFEFRHGPGGVAGHGKVSYEKKYKDLTYDQTLVYAFGDPYWADGTIRSSLDRISQTIFVPKSYKTFRTISMEPTTLQYLQQGIWREINRLVQADRRLRNRIGFQKHNEAKNRRLAQEGSLNRNYATIDLSAASDSVSYKLVMKLFAGTNLKRYLYATRSKRTLLPDGRLIDLKKFAPMGSALCFPVETIIFAAICHYVTREHFVAGDYSVFGDDIIVPTQCVEDIILVLETLGFRVNRTKSFYQSDCWFRESCGGEYCDGFDVTPMRISRKYESQPDDVGAFGLIDLANEAYNRGYRNLRQFFLNKYRSVTTTRQYPVKDKKTNRRKIKRVSEGLVAWFSPNALLSDNYTNYHTERRWNHDLQRIECRVHSPQSSFKGNTDEAIRLRHWFENTAFRTSIGDGYQSETRRAQVLTKSCWREKPYEELDQLFIDHFTQ